MAKRLYSDEERKERKKLSDKKYRENNLDKERERLRLNYKKYNTENKEMILAKARQYRKDNIEKYQLRDKVRGQKLRQDPFYIKKEKIRCAIKGSIYRGGYTKNSKSYEILGCTYEEFIKYIEAQFEPWMNWNNHGYINRKPPTKRNERWEFDHQIPIATAKTEEDIIKLNHYTNFQPLCGYINRYIKGDKY